MPVLLSILVFLGVAGTACLFGYRRYVLAGRVYENLEERSHPGGSSEGTSNPTFFTVRKIATALARKLPASASTASALHLKLMSAGYRGQTGAVVFYGIKLISMFVLAVVMIGIEFGSSRSLSFKAMGVLVGVMAGFRLPDFFLGRKVKHRKQALRKALPDALDLVIVCAEAGLTIDRCFRNVTRQLAIVHRELSDELALVTAEMNAGLRRKEALDNLAIRTQEPEIKKFVSVVSQADKFGTSMGEALRTHAEYLRVRRRQDAEEKASKVGVKMIFPIFFFIMPCMMLVTLGPAVLVIARKLMPALSGAVR
jgi:tight adherence protein C